MLVQAKHLLPLLERHEVVHVDVDFLERRGIVVDLAENLLNNVASTPKLKQQPRGKWKRGVKRRTGWGHWHRKRCFAHSPKEKTLFYRVYIPCTFPANPGIRSILCSSEKFYREHPFLTGNRAAARPYCNLIARE